MSAPDKGQLCSILRCRHNSPTAPLTGSDHSPPSTTHAKSHLVATMATPPEDVARAGIEGPDIMNDPAFDRNKTESTTAADGDTCRICRSEGSEEEPLFYPCKCSGSIKFVHQDCLMEWLSHSNKKYCELCKTPFRFTKLYNSNMPQTLPMAIFLQKACIHTLQYLLTWARGFAVAAVWLVVLPWCIRWSWRGLFWLLDARWARDAWLSKMEALALQAASEKEAQGTGVMEMLSTTSSEDTSASGEPIALNLSKFIVGALLNPWRPLASPHNAVNTTSNARLSAQSTLLSDIRAVNSLTKSAWTNRFILDVLEGQIVTFLVVIAFILVFLIREWVVQQQPIINAAANAREDELNLEAAEQALQRRRHRLHRPHPEMDLPQDFDDVFREDDEKTFMGWEAMATLFHNAGVPYDRDGPDQDLYMREVGVALLEALEEMVLAMDAGATAEEVQDNINSILTELPQDEKEMWVELLNDQETLDGVIPDHLRNRFAIPPLPTTQADEAGSAVYHEYEEEESDEEALRRPLMPPRGASPTPHHVWQAIQERPEGSEQRERHADDGSNGSEGSWEPLITSDSSSSTASHGADQEGQNVADLLKLNSGHDEVREVEQKSPVDANQHIPESEDGSNIAQAGDDTPPEVSSEHSDDAGGNDGAQDPIGQACEGSPEDETNTQVASLPSPAVPDQAESIPRQDDHNTSQGPNEVQVNPPKFFLQRLLDWFWADIVPDNTDANPLPAILEEAIIQNEADEAPFVHAHRGGGEADEPEPAVNQEDPEVLQAAAEAGLDADAMDEAEDLEGILELIGMQGPLVGLLQTAMFCGVLITTALWAAIGTPYLFGKLALLFLGDPIAFLVMTPIRLVSIAADTIVDGTIYAGAAATYFGIQAFAFVSLWLKGSELKALDWLSTRSNSAFDAAGGRLSGMFSANESLEAGFLMGSVHAHQSLRNLQSDISGFVAIVSRCVVVINHHLQHSTLTSSLQKLASSLWSAIIEAKQHYSLLKDVIRETMANTIKSGSLTVTIPQHEQYMDPSLAYWSATDRCLAVFAGYAFLAVIGTMYLLRKEPIFTTPSLQKAEKSFTDFLKQAGGVLKVILIISIEMLVFPLYCGMLLDCALLPLFQHASFSSRLAYAARSPCMFAFVHWFIGTCYMFHFALFVSMCRRVLRPGVLYFIRDPDDPTFHPVRDVLERNVTTQLRKIAFSALVYGGLVMFCLGGVVSGIDIVFKGVFPIQWATPEPMLEFPIDFLVYNLLAPIVAKFLLPSEGVETLFGIWLKRCARLLHLSDFLFGEKNADGDKPTRTEAAESEDKPDDESFADGKYVRAPASDQVRIPKGDLVFLEVTNDNERIDGQPDNDTGMHGKQNRNFVKVFVPSWFRVRIALFIAGLWVFAAATGVGVTIIPMAFGRKLLAVALPGRVQTNDLYAFSIGLLALGSVLFAVMRGHAAYTKIEDYTLPPSVVVTVREAAKKQCMRILRSIYVWGFALVVVPSLFALVLQLYLILPLHTYTSSAFPPSSNPTNSTLTATNSTATSISNATLFSLPNSPHDPSFLAPHKISILQDWTLGFLYGRIVLRLLLLSRHSRPATALRQITAAGWTNPNAALATRAFILPTLLLFSILLFLPAGVAGTLYTLTRTLVGPGLGGKVFRVKVFRYAYPVVAAQGAFVWGVLEVGRGAKRWRGRIRDEVYLVGERLHNFGEKKPPRQARSSITPTVVG